jgi:hypothetical protein
VEINSTSVQDKKPYNTQQFDIGRNGDEYFQGAIDEVRLWNIALTPGEIQNGMLTPLTGEEEGLIGYWSFENNTNDSSGNDNHGNYVDAGLFTTVENGNNESQFIDSQANPNGKNLGEILYFTGEGERQAITRILDTAVIDHITFDLIFSNGTNGGAAAEEGKDVVLEYSKDDGNNWQQLAIYDTEDYSQWTTIQQAIPDVARADRTRFRWQQTQLDGSTGNNWGLANVQVGSYLNNPAPQIGYIEVKLDKPFEGPQGLWVNYDIGGTAQQNEDYLNSRYRKVSTDASSERDGIIVPQGETSGRTYIVANPDEIEETDEKVNITLRPHNFDDEAGSSDTNTNYRVDLDNKTREVTIKDNGAYGEKAIFLDQYDRVIDGNNPLYVDTDGKAIIKVKLASIFSNDEGNVTITVGGIPISFNNTNWDQAQTITLESLDSNSSLSYSYSNQDGDQSGSLPVDATIPPLLQTEEGNKKDLIPVIPTVSIIKGRDVREGDNQPGEFVVNLDAPAPEGGLEVQYSVNGTATKGEDYKDGELTGSITVAAGETQVVLPVQAVDDKTSEKEKTVEVTLVQPSVQGLTGEYFKDKNLQNLAFTRTDSTVKFEFKKAGDEFQINTHTDGQQSNPAIAPLSDGGFVVTWHSGGQDGSVFGVYGQRYDKNG